VVQPINVFVECVIVIIDIQVLLLIIDQRGCSIMSTCSQTCRVTHLTFDDARVVMYIHNGETKVCSESQMRSMISRGASKWSGDKVSYKGSWN
jgi:hypothetical protein